MNGSNLLDTMARNVAEECERTLAEARSTAEVTIAEAREKGVSLRASTLEATQSSMELLDLRWKQKAESEAVRAALSMKNSAIEATLSHVEEAIRTLAQSSEFEGILDTLLSELMEVVEGEVVVLAPEAHVDRVRKWLAEHGKEALSVEGTAILNDGVAVQDADRKWRISNSLSTRYRRVEQATRRVCMSDLFDEGGGDS